MLPYGAVRQQKVWWCDGWREHVSSVRSRIAIQSCPQVWSNRVRGKSTRRLTSRS